MAIKPAPRGIQDLMRANLDGMIDPQFVPMSEEESAFRERLKLYSDRVSIEKDPSQLKSRTLSKSTSTHVQTVGKSPRRSSTVYSTRSKVVIASLSLIIVGVVTLLTSIKMTSVDKDSRPAWLGGSDKSSMNTSFKIESFEIRHFRHDDEDKIEFKGLIGSQSFSCEDGEYMKIDARLSAPGYCYLIALNPDGSIRLWQDGEKGTPPKRTVEFTYPGKRNVYYSLTDGIGLQAIVLVASRNPLPAFDSWRARNNIAWKISNDTNAWRFDGHEIILLGTNGGSGKRDPRSPLTTPVPRPPFPFEEVVQNLKHCPDVDAIQAIAFPVLADNRSDMP